MPKSTNVYDAGALIKVDYEFIDDAFNFTRVHQPDGEGERQCKYPRAHEGSSTIISLTSDYIVFERICMLYVLRTGTNVIVAQQSPLDKYLNKSDIRLRGVFLESKISTKSYIAPFG